MQLAYKTALMVSTYSPFLYSSICNLLPTQQLLYDTLYSVPSCSIIYIYCQYYHRYHYFIDIDGNGIGEPA